MAKAEDFFLSEVKGGFEHFRAPMSSASSATPLVDGLAIYSDQEKKMFDAESSIFLSFWTFEPGLKISHPEVRSKVKTWAELLLRLARDKAVSVRILMTDFDPMFFTLEHRLLWKRYRQLVDGAKRFGVPKDMFQVVVARHPAEWTPGALLNLVIEARYQAVSDELAGLKDKAKDALAMLPGLWDKVEVKPTGISLRDPNKIFPVIPGSHHQKLIIVDERIAYVAGINHISENLDDRRHLLLRTDLRWHDGCVRVQGRVVQDLFRVASGMWNAQRTRAQSFIEEANKQLPGFNLPLRQTDDLKADDTIPRPPSGRVRAQVWRTVSVGITAADRPDTTCKDIMEGSLNAIRLAENFVYIENQYLRDERLSNAIIERFTAKSSLNVVVVLPNVSEEEFKKKADPISQTGAALQFKIVEALKTALGDKFGAFTLFTPTRPPKMVYVHNKVMIIDDVFATLGSGNANERGFELDTELNLAWHDPRSVKALRRDLWHEHLGSGCPFDTWKPASYVREWTKRAKRNERLAEKLRSGFVLPFANDVLGFDWPVIPNWLAQADVPGASRDRLVPGRDRTGSIA